MKGKLKYIIASILTAFALLTLFLSTSVIFDLFGIREKEGNYVLFIVQANFVSSILYLFSAFGFIKDKKWTTILLAISSIILAAAFIGLNFHINSGGIYEHKTFNAMIFRTALTVVFTLTAYFTITKNKSLTNK